MRNTLLAAAVALLSVAGGAGAQKINAAGATFPYPIYSKWFSEYSAQQSGVEINYQSIGSGGGIRQVTSGTVDFGASGACRQQHGRSWPKGFGGKGNEGVAGPVRQMPGAIGYVELIDALQNYIPCAASGMPPVAGLRPASKASRTRPRQCTGEERISDFQLYVPAHPGTWPECS